MGARALVVGSAGQDGSYLCEQLVAQGVSVAGLTRQGLEDPIGHLAGGVFLEDKSEMRRLIGDGAFDQIYFLAAYHHSSQDALGEQTELIQRSFGVHVTGLLNVLDAMTAARSTGALFYAASSHVFGVVNSSPQTEATPLAPVCAYGVSKTAGVHICRLYRQDYGIRASVGFLYNHESPRRSPAFLSRKVAKAVVEIERGRREKLVLGDLDARVDWGYAPEYIDAMQRIAGLDEPGDFLIASGRTASVQNLVEAAFGHAGLDWQKHVTVEPAIVQKIKRGLLVGDAAKLAKATGWAARTPITEIAAIMVDAERKLGTGL